MVFLHLSDIHFLIKYIKEKDEYNSIFNNMTNPIVQIEKVLKKINKDSLGFIIITGDLVEGGKSEDYKVLKENLDSLFGDIPYIVTLGNHDNKRAFYKGWLNEDEGRVRFEEETRCNLCRYEDGRLYVDNVDVLEKSKF